MKLILMVGFSSILGNVQIEDRKMTKGKLIDQQKIVSRFMGKLVKMIRDAGSKFGYYSIQPKIRQISLDQSYELTEEDLFNELSN